MGQSLMRAEKLTPHADAEIHGADLSTRLAEVAFKASHGCLIESGVIFFRDQRLTPDQQKDFGRQFGGLHGHPAVPGLVEGHPEIPVIRAGEKSKHVAGGVWHSNVSCDPELRWTAQSHSGTTAASSTTPCGTTTRSGVMGIA